MKSYEEMSEEEIRAFGEKLKREQEERIIFNKRCDEMTAFGLVHIVTLAEPSLLCW